MKLLMLVWRGGGRRRGEVGRVRGREQEGVLVEAVELEVGTPQVGVEVLGVGTARVGVGRGVGIGIGAVMRLVLVFTGAISLVRVGLQEKVALVLVWEDVLICVGGYRGRVNLDGICVRDLEKCFER